MEDNGFRIFIETGNQFVNGEHSLPFILTTVGDMKKQTSIERPNGHHKHHLIVVTSGKAEFCGPNGQFALQEGEGVFWRKGVPHWYKRTYGNFDTAFVTFQSSGAELDYYGVSDELRFRYNPRFLTAVNSLYNFSTGNSNLLTRSAEGYSFVADWLYSILEPSIPMTVRIKRFLEANISNQISLDDIAEAVHMSKYALCHFYRTECGTTVMNELRSMRISKAMRLLRFGSQPIGRIARLCGFVNLSYFDKVFYSETGMTPNEYRLNGK